MHCWPWVIQCSRVCILWRVYWQVNKLKQWEIRNSMMNANLKNYISINQTICQRKSFAGKPAVQKTGLPVFSDSAKNRPIPVPIPRPGTSLIHDSIFMDTSNNENWREWKKDEWRWDETSQSDQFQRYPSQVFYWSFPSSRQVAFATAKEPYLLRSVMTSYKGSVVFFLHEEGSTQNNCICAGQSCDDVILSVWLAQLVKAPTLSQRACMFIRAWLCRRSEVQLPGQTVKTQASILSRSVNE